MKSDNRSNPSRVILHNIYIYICVCAQRQWSDREMRRLILRLGSRGVLQNFHVELTIVIVSCSTDRIFFFSVNFLIIN